MSPRASCCVRRPRFSYALEQWSKLNGVEGQRMALTTAIAGVAIGRRCASGRAPTATSRSRPRRRRIRRRSALSALVGAFNGTDSLPRDVYDALLADLRAQPALVEPIVVAAAGSDEGIAAAARSFVRGVLVGAKAYDGTGAAPAAARPRPLEQPPVRRRLRPRRRLPLRPRRRLPLRPRRRLPRRARLRLPRPRAARPGPDPASAVPSAPGISDPAGTRECRARRWGLLTRAVADPVCAGE